MKKEIEHFPLLLTTYIRNIREKYKDIRKLRHQVVA